MAPEPGSTPAKQVMSSLAKVVEGAMLVAGAPYETQVCLAPAVGPCFSSELLHVGTFWCVPFSFAVYLTVKRSWVSRG